MFCQLPRDAAGKRTQRHARLADLRIDTVFGDYPLNAVRREHVSDWVGRMVRTRYMPNVSNKRSTCGDTPTRGFGGAGDGNRTRVASLED